MRKICIGVSILALVLMGMVNVFGAEKTPTGFYYPTKTNNFGFYAGWLSDSCGEGGISIHGHGGYGSNNAGSYHIGKDIAGDYGSPVYAISDGIVLDVNASASWGGGTARGLFIKHRLIDGSEFVMLYGHVATSLIEGDRVVAGEQVATIAITELPHVHSGISPGSNVPASPWGRMGCSNWPVDSPAPNTTNQFADPINWIETKTPLNTTSHPNGTLVRDVVTGDRYYIENGKKRLVLASYSWFLERNEISVSPEEISFYADGTVYDGSPTQDFMGYPEGSLIQQNGYNAVYVISEGIPRWLNITAQEFTSFGYRWSNVETVYFSFVPGEPFVRGDFNRRYIVFAIADSDGGVGGGFDGVPVFVFGSPQDMPNDYSSGNPPPAPDQVLAGSGMLFVDRYYDGESLPEVRPLANLKPLIFCGGCAKE